MNTDTKYTDTELHGIAEQICEAFNKAIHESLHNDNEQASDLHYNNAYTILRNVAEGRSWADGVDL